MYSKQILSHYRRNCDRYVYTAVPKNVFLFHSLWDNIRYYIFLENKWCCSKCWFASSQYTSDFFIILSIFCKKVLPRDYTSSTTNDPSIVFNMLTCIEGVMLVNNKLTEVRSGLGKIYRITINQGLFILCGTIHYSSVHILWDPICNPTCLKKRFDRTMLLRKERDKDLLLLYTVK